ncbi:hypothetical protein AJ78_08569 [Emergomyces pasteurianus Ep9510]|uniref:Protein kinase domain-containing protein n=1 Tax=Emergomyces pasteurianus Ep9510 TaxID=1447872 RepID=A0A1J9PRD0_9EURO|nr:hypothetical protein AJ78_08569 [Emergomyces pasteurianus Ep9510]
MNVSLAQVFSTSLDTLRFHEVAAFSREILEGLSYIHDLHITHGQLNSENILLSVETAAIKIDRHISNFKLLISMLKQDHEAQTDIQSVSTMITECLEPHIILRHGDISISENFSDNLREFQTRIRTTFTSELLKHDFLQLSSGSQCLKCYIRTARKSASKNLEILTEWTVS